MVAVQIVAQVAVESPVRVLGRAVAVGIVERALPELDMASELLAVLVVETVTSVVMVKLLASRVFVALGIAG